MNVEVSAPRSGAPVPVGDETEALRAALDALRDAAEGWPTPNFYTDAADAGEKALARVAGLEAREASLRDALADDLRWAIEVLEAAAPSRDQDEGHYANRALVYLHEIRARALPSDA